ncbi:MAG: glycosyltransferase [Candidatus Omnitrophica bacterium]|nr:glycosyltransferase [Candidatus Omnitrophota bacterium]
MDAYKKIIIGSDNSHFKNIKNATVLELQPHKKLIEYMKKSKLLLYPSINDANPNTVREAVYNKCLVLISNNIGYYEIFPEYSVCTSYNKNEWLDKSIYLISNYDKIIASQKLEFNSGESIIDFINNFL